jgi:hypothetical protein
MMTEETEIRVRLNNGRYQAKILPAWLRDKEVGCRVSLLAQRKE